MSSCSWANIIHETILKQYWNDNWQRNTNMLEVNRTQCHSVRPITTWTIQGLNPSTCDNSKQLHWAGHVHQQPMYMSHLPYVAHAQSPTKNIYIFLATYRT